MAVQGISGAVKPVVPLGAGSYGGSISRAGAPAMSPNQRNSLMKIPGIPISNIYNYSAPATSRGGSMFAGANMGALLLSISGEGQGEYGQGEYGQGRGVIQGAPIIQKGASRDAYDAQQASLLNEYQGEEARWKGRLKTAPKDQPVKKRELPNEPTVKTIEGESTIRSLPKDYSNVYGMGPGRRPMASSNLGQGNYRLF